MMIVKVKSKERAFTIPVPYLVLRLGSGILTSAIVQRKMKDWLSKDGGREGAADGSRSGARLAQSILTDRSTKRAIRQLIGELQQCKGTVLVDVQAEDGTEVSIRL
ncbi:hypothetical protein I8J29_04095 [Paenibacillus sp. MWE-103]|uniref:Uncharacterized protein n=1 Tax=Paenibacillus artemisiicola TaxID=1172618 RepID=A0ABS3W4X3_9BACL|nr:hypothetical protein [Paenibacillus artemisiicola]MBO7743362.1 hypothetical protein [Paenibacillus artemisiicola]